jgi:hypothetical protein
VTARLRSLQETHLNHDRADRVSRGRHLWQQFSVRSAGPLSPTLPTWGLLVTQSHNRINAHGFTGGNPASRDRGQDNRQTGKRSRIRCTYAEQPRHQAVRVSAPPSPMTTPNKASRVPCHSTRRDRQLDVPINEVRLCDNDQPKVGIRPSVDTSTSRRRILDPLTSKRVCKGILRCSLLQVELRSR